MPNPISFIEHLRAYGYHPRSDKHSNALSLAILNDLLAHCLKIRERAATGHLVYDLNFTLIAGTAEWNVDLVLGQPELGTPAPGAGIAITRARPATVQVAIELKAAMTEHRKAVKNRKRDLEAHHEHVHNYNNEAVAGGVLIINASERFRSPLRPAETVHRNPPALVAHCLNELTSVARRGGTTGYGLEAKCAIVVDADNIDLQKASYLPGPPSPTVGNPLHYDSFIQTICEFYTRRFG